MTAAGIAILLTMMGFLKVYNEEHLQRWRPSAKYYMEDEFRAAADSLLDNWKENEIKYWDMMDSLEAIGRHEAN